MQERTSLHGATMTTIQFAKISNGRFITREFTGTAEECAEATNEGTTEGWEVVATFDAVVELPSIVAARKNMLGR